jgi:epoxyqueuosine reductase
VTTEVRSREVRIKERAQLLGFEAAGIVPLGPAPTFEAFAEWLAHGYAGDMQYLARGAEKRRDTRSPAQGMQSAIVVTMDYGGTEPPGPVARYARGTDYHDVMLERLGVLHEWLEGDVGRRVHAKAYVDTGPILERDLAQRAGLGWIGKNTMLVHPERGSFFFLGALLVALELEPDAPFEADRCGTCTRCLDACPTDALTEPRVMDATKCISYLTIEHRGSIPVELRTAVGDHLYGCDVCQDVCPWNVRFATDLREDSFAARDLVGSKDARTLARDVLALTETELSAALQGSPMRRAKMSGLKRNAAVVLGNVGDVSDVELLSRATGEDDVVVREHAIWALEQIATRSVEVEIAGTEQRAETG